MIAWGMNALNHGSSLAVFRDCKLISNTFVKDDELDSVTIRKALDLGSPDRLYWYERPWVKKARQIYAGQYNTAFRLDNLPSTYIKKVRLNYAEQVYTPHHASHAAAGYYTSPFNHCAIIVLDAIGEFECATIWEGSHGEIKKVWSRSYPHSLGLFYSAFTKLIGLTPIKDEFLLEQMAAQGDPNRYINEVRSYMGIDLYARKNMHRGINDWPHVIENIHDQCDIAAAVQAEFEYQVDMVMTEAKKITGADCLVYMGGCAMNKTANKSVVEPKFKYIWSLPQPGDPSSSIGAVLYHTKWREWDYKWDPVKHIEISV